MGRLTRPSQTAGHRSVLHGCRYPGHGLSLDIEQRVLRALDDKRLALASWINAQGYGLGVAIRAIQELDVEQTTIKAP